MNILKKLTGSRTEAVEKLSGSRTEEKKGLTLKIEELEERKPTNVAWGE